jgi:hypothetical protein
MTVVKEFAKNMQLQESPDEVIDPLAPAEDAAKKQAAVDVALKQRFGAPEYDPENPMVFRSQTSRQPPPTQSQPPAPRGPPPVSRGVDCEYGSGSRAGGAVWRPPVPGTANKQLWSSPSTPWLAPRITPRSCRCWWAASTTIVAANSRTEPSTSTEPAIGRFFGGQCGCPTHYSDTDVACATSAQGIEEQYPEVLT